MVAVRGCRVVVVRALDPACCEINAGVNNIFVVVDTPYLELFGKALGIAVLNFC